MVMMDISHKIVGKIGGWVLGSENGMFKIMK